MRLRHLLGLVAAMCCTVLMTLAASQQLNGASAPFTLQITANPNDRVVGSWDFASTSVKTVKSGTAVEVGIRKINQTGSAIARRPQNGGAYGYHYDVRDSNGTLLSAKPRGDQRGWIKSGGPGLLRGSKEMVLEPGAKDVVSVNLSRFYDFSKPGTYTIQVSQHVSNDPNSAIVKSNIIDLTITPQH